MKAAYVQESIYVGANNLAFLENIKSKEEVIGDVIALLQSPIKNVVSALQSGGNTIHGVLETLKTNKNKKINNLFKLNKNGRYQSYC